MAYGDIIREISRDTEGNVYGDVDMGGWTISARRFRAPIREGFHYFGSFDGIDYVGPCNTPDDAWQEIGEIRAEIRSDVFNFHVDWDHTEHVAREIERASIIALAKRLEADDNYFESEASRTGPGRLEGNDDRRLAVALDIIAGHGAADDEAGDVEWGLHGSRVGRYILWTNSQGFLTLDDGYTSADDAQAALDAEAESQYPDEEESES